MNSGKAGRNRQVVLTLTPEVEVGLSLPSWMSTLHRFSVAYEGPALAKSHSILDESDRLVAEQREQRPQVCVVCVREVKSSSLILSLA